MKGSRFTMSVSSAKLGTALGCGRLTLRRAGAGPSSSLELLLELSLELELELLPLSLSRAPASRDAPPGIGPPATAPAVPLSNPAVASSAGCFRRFKFRGSFRLAAVSSASPTAASGGAASTAAVPVRFFAPARPLEGGEVAPVAAVAVSAPGDLRFRRWADSTAAVTPSASAAKSETSVDVLASVAAFLTLCFVLRLLPPLLTPDCDGSSFVPVEKYLRPKFPLMKEKRLENPMSAESGAETRAASAGATGNVLTLRAAA